jgi:type III secretion protein L
MSAPPRIFPGAAPLPARRIPAAVHEADRRVRERVATAEAEAQRIRAEAEASRDAVLARAREDGRRDGMAAAAAALALAAGERERLLAAAERDVVALALTLARKVLGRELGAGEGAVVDLAAQALAQVRDRREVALRVNPADAAALRAAEGRLGGIVARARLAIREDPGMPQGGVVVETDAGCADAGIEAQLDRLEVALAEAFGP